jgi:hypothetical protein
MSINASNEASTSSRVTWWRLRVEDDSSADASTAVAGTETGTETGTLSSFLEDFFAFFSATGSAGFATSATGSAALVDFEDFVVCDCFDIFLIKIYIFK